MTAQTQSFLQGEVVDERYHLGQHLGGSDHSAVFLTQFGEIHPKKAAIKLLPARRGTAELQLSRWRLAANLSHPHLLRILDMGRCEVGSTPMLYVVTELASENLAEIIPQRPLSPDEGREMLVPVVDALSLIHSRGFVHGHVKPSNIIVVGEEIKLSSDSICRLSDPVENVGHPSIYDPPESNRNGATTAGDIWSLGVTIVEALSQETLAWNPAERREPAIPESVPPPFAEFARHCLRRDPKNRWTAATIRARLPRARAQAPDRPSERQPERAPEQIESPGARVVDRAPERVPEREPDLAAQRLEEGVPERVPTPAARRASPPLAAKAQALLQWSGSALDTCGHYAHDAWRRLEAVEWRRYAIAGWQRAASTWRSLPIDAVRRHALAHWRRYAFGASAIVFALAVIFVASKLGERRSAGPGPGTTSTEVLSQTGVKPSRTRPAAAKPIPHTRQPSAPAPQQPTQQATQQPTITAPTAAPRVPPSNTPLSSSASPSAQGRVLHQVMPDVPKKASDTIWGTVRVGVRVNVDAAGNVTAASPDSSGPSRYFARLSLDAARNWKFAPPQVNGAGVASTWILHFSYTNRGSTVQPSQVEP